ncbi:MAG: PQQ-binding-like beta-propeller repeat protein [Anaerolineae bacterium]|nr:PQQ-binding-like beta-propeller repeat protein [Anaerolineae bacterium]
MARTLYGGLVALALVGLLTTSGCGSVINRYVDLRRLRLLSRSERLYHRAEQLAQEGKPAEALLAYRQAYQADPSYAPALARLAASYTAQGRRRSAARLYDQYLRHVPEDRDAQQVLLDLYVDLGDVARATALAGELGLPAPPAGQAALPGGLALRWASFLEDQAISGLAASASGETIFATTQGGSLYALAAEDGSERWHFAAEGPVVSAPLYTGESQQPLIIFGDESGTVYALSAADGREAWRFRAAGPIFGSPAAAGDVVYVGSTDGNLYALARADGNLLWAFVAGEPVHAGPLVAGEAVYVGSLSHELVAVDARTGAERWRFTALAPVESTPAFASGRLYFGANDSRLYCLDPRTGDELWHYSTGDSIYAPPAIGTDVLYLASASHDLYALSADTGELQWQYRGESFLTTAPALDGSRLYFVATADPHLYVLHASTGELVARIDTGDWPSGSPLLLGKDLYVGEKDGSVLAYRLP